jgi:hypothetical protein
MFAGNGEQRPFIESILFQIEIDCLLMKSSKPFSNIGHVSFIKDENEVLFSFIEIYKSFKILFKVS